MSDTIQFPEQIDYSALAAAKIEIELKEFSGDSKAKAVSKFVAATLSNFCEQDGRFAEVVYKTVRTLSDCCAEIMKGVGNSISDIDVYRAAVRHYFPNADIEFTMNITFTGEAPSEEEMNKKLDPPKKKKPTAKSAKQPDAAKKTAAKPSKQPKQESIQLSLF